MKASFLLLVLSWLPPLAAQALETEHLERAVLPLELAAVSFTPTEPATVPLSTVWGYQPLEAADVSSNLPLHADAAPSAALHATASQALAELLKRDPLGLASSRSHVPEPTHSALLGVAVLTGFAVWQGLRRPRAMA